MTPRSRLHVVLLAGGSGTRFWPASRAKHPKQFLAFAPGPSLLAATWERARRLAPAERIWVVAPKPLAAAVRRELPRLRAGRLIVEPSPKDTAPAIALACTVIARRDPEAIVAILPCDHVIENAGAFAAAIGIAAKAADRGALVCLGVAPDRPATGFGYIRLGEVPKRGGAARVRAFVEKPDAARARRFVRSGRYLWNGGMFVWRVDHFLAELLRVQPAIHAAAAAAALGSKAAWGRAPRVSIDYAVMEKAHDVAVVPLDAGWDDVGSWDAAARLAAPARRTGRGGHVLIDSEGSAVFGSRRLVAILDLPGIVVVETPDALLVVSRRASERMKAVVAAVEAAGRADLL